MANYEFRVPDTCVFKSNTAVSVVTFNDAQNSNQWYRVPVFQQNVSVDDSLRNVRKVTVNDNTTYDVSYRKPGTDPKDKQYEHMEVSGKALFDLVSASPFVKTKVSEAKPVEKCYLNNVASGRMRELPDGNGVAIGIRDPKTNEMYSVETNGARFKSKRHDGSLISGYMNVLLGDSITPMTVFKVQSQGENQQREPVSMTAGEVVALYEAERSDFVNRREAAKREAKVASNAVEAPEVPALDASAKESAPAPAPVPVAESAVVKADTAVSAGKDAPSVAPEVPASGNKVEAVSAEVKPNVPAEPLVSDTRKDAEADVEAKPARPLPEAPSGGDSLSDIPELPF